MKKKISKIAITLSFLLAFTNPVIADEKSGLRLYHVKITNDLKDACMKHFPTGITMQQSSSMYKKIILNNNNFILQYTSMGDCFLNEYR
ncbi:hypothetical protein N9565_00295 [Amylibacter sp.]|nr:hypothetical protein [Amylibacter sp.]